MAQNSLTKTTFSAGPEDALAAADAYGAKAVTSIYADKTKYGIDLPDSPVGIKIKPPPIPGVASLDPLKSNLGLKAPVLPTAEVLNRVMSSDVSIKNCFTNMSDAAKNLLKIPGELLSKVESTINGVISKLKNLGNFDPSELFKKLGDLKAIGCTVNSLTDGKFSLSITDKGGLSGLISGITNQASFMGVNNVFSSISSVIKDKDVLQSALTNILPNAVKDVNLLKDLATTGIAGNIKNLMPNVSGNTIHNFRIDPGTKNFELPNIFGNIDSTLNTIDSSWNRVSRTGETLLSGTLMTTSSASDFHKTLEAKVMSSYKPIGDPSALGFTMPVYDDPNAFLMLTNNVGFQSVDISLGYDFPTLPITTNETIVNSTLVDKVQYGLNSSDTSFKSYSNDVVVETVKIDSSTQKINVKQFDEEGVLIEPIIEPLPNKISIPLIYPSEGTYLGTTQDGFLGTLTTIVTYQGPMKGDKPSYDQTVTLTNYKNGNSLISTETRNVSSILTE